MSVDVATINGSMTTVFQTTIGLLRIGVERKGTVGVGMVSIRMSPVVVGSLLGSSLFPINEENRIFRATPGHLDRTGE
ncbi:MAG: hypothetical protein KAS54_03350 [Dehalococcoidia bacterium]|nr:hypothetical protein [Dehalococcoidia bacterium]